MLESIVWRKAREEWGQEMEVKPKLIMIKKITDLEEWAGSVGLRRRADRRMMIKLRGGTAAFQFETGRGRGWPEKQEYAKNVKVAR